MPSVTPTLASQIADLDGNSQMMALTDASLGAIAQDSRLVLPSRVACSCAPPELFKPVAEGGDKSSLAPTAAKLGPCLVLDDGKQMLESCCDDADDVEACRKRAKVERSPLFSCCST